MKSAIIPHMETFNGNRAIILHMEAVCWYPRIRDGQQSHKIEKCAGTPMSITTYLYFSATLRKFSTCSLLVLQHFHLSEDMTICDGRAFFHNVFGAFWRSCKVSDKFHTRKSLAYLYIID